MATKKTGGSAHSPLDPKVADKLLDLLSTDNEFRRLFKKDATAALAKVGDVAAKELMKGRPPTSPPHFRCMRVRHIAPKAEIISARDELKRHLTSLMVYHDPHCFEAGKIPSALRRK